MKVSLLLLAILFQVFAVNAQSTWTLCNSPTTEDLESVFMPEPNKVLIGGNSGVLLISTDFGSTFSSVSLGSTDDIDALYFFNSTDGIMLLGNKFMKSADGGLTWTFVSNIPGNAKAFHFINDTVGYIACDLGLAFRTTNGGLSWSSLVTGITERLEAVWFKTAADGFFGGRNSTSLHTLNQGSSFTSNVIPANGDIKDIQFVNATNGYSCGDNGEVLFTLNGGTSWVQQTTPNTNVDMQALHFVDNQNGWCSGEDGVMIHTSNGGTNWLSDITNTNQSINNVHFFDNNQGFGVADNGVIIRRGTGTVSVDERNSDELEILQIYPNPTSGSFTIQWDDKSREIPLQIRDLAGNLIQEIILSNPLTTMDARELKLAPGLYFCQLQSAQYSKPLRLLVL